MAIARKPEVASTENRSLSVSNLKYFLGSPILCHLPTLTDRLKVAQSRLIGAGGSIPKVSDEKSDSKFEVTNSSCSIQTWRCGGLIPKMSDEKSDSKNE